MARLNSLQYEVTESSWEKFAELIEHSPARAPPGAHVTNAGLTGAD